MRLEKSAALREGNGMRLHGRDLVERSAGIADEMLLDLDLNLVQHGKRASAQQVHGVLDDAGDRVLDWREHVISDAFIKTAVEICNRSSRHELTLAAEQFMRGFLAERATFALKRDSWFCRLRAHKAIPV